MKFSAKPWAEQWARSWTVEKRSVLVFGTSIFRNRVVSKMLEVVYGLSRKLRAEFCVIFKKFRIYGLSLDFSEARYGWTYGQKWKIYVKCFCVIARNLITCRICV